MSDEYDFAQVIVTPVLFLSLSWLAVTIRLYVKRYMVKSYTWDDWLMLAGLIAFSVDGGLNVIAARDGFGKHQNDIPAQDVPTLSQIWLIEEIIYIITNLLVKTSIAVLLRRLTTHRVQRHIVTWTMVLYMVGSIAAFFLVLFQCYPVSKYWLPDTEGYCYPHESFIRIAYVNCGCSTITDLIFAVIPILMVWNLQNLTSRSKLSISVVLGLGIITCIINVIRFGFIWTIGADEDFTYVLVPIAILSHAEMGLSILAGSLATFRPILRLFARHFSNASFQSQIKSEWECSPQSQKSHRHSNFHQQFRKFSLSRDSKNVVDQCPYPHLSAAMHDVESCHGSCYDIPHEHEIINQPPRPHFSFIDFSLSTNNDIRRTSSSGPIPYARNSRLSITQSLFGGNELDCGRDSEVSEASCIQVIMSKAKLAELPQRPIDSTTTHTSANDTSTSLRDPWKRPSDNHHPSEELELGAFQSEMDGMGLSK